MNIIRKIHRVYIIRAVRALLIMYTATNFGLHIQLNVCMYGCMSECVSVRESERERERKAKREE